MSERENSIDTSTLSLKNGRVDWVGSVGMEVRFNYKNKSGIFKILEYDSGTEYVTVEHLNILYKINATDLKHCRLNRFFNLITSNFKIEIGGKFLDHKRNIVIIDREYRKRYDKNGDFKCNDKWYKYKCDKCEYEGWAMESELLRGSGCSCCIGKVVVKGINDIGTTRPEFKKFFIGSDYEKYTKGSNKLVKLKCPDCGNTKYMNVYDLTRRGICCSCSDKNSYPTKFMFKILSLLNISFKKEKSFEWGLYFYNGKYRKCYYDFYFKLNNKEYIVEMDGAWHKRDNNMSGVTLKDTKYIDSEKDRLAKENNIEVIRIDCEKSDFNFIKDNIYSSRLNEILELDKVDWKEVEMFALSNLVKVACDYKKENPELSTSDIAKLMGMSQTGIANYLRQGNLKYNMGDDKQ